MTSPGTLTGSGIGALLREKRIIVCCGAGGVGKTTSAAALALAAARAGRKVLVLTIDPSRRLAETLGVAQNPPSPVPLPADRAAAAGIQAGALDAWLLDPKRIADESVRRLIADPAEQERLLQNRIYQQVSAMVAGMHEYTAMEALHRLMEEGRYELVILDTPPSRNALDFLEAPGRLGQLLDMKVFRAFLPKAGSMFSRAASRIIERVLAAVFGHEFAAELTGFLAAFAQIFGMLNLDVSRMRTILGGADAAFLLVCSPAPAAIEEVYFFRAKTRDLGLPFRGFILNRSRGHGAARVFPDASMLAPDAGPAGQAAMGKLQGMAREEQRASQRDQDLLAKLASEAGTDAVAVPVPNLPLGADDMSTLLTVADLLARS